MKKNLVLILAGGSGSRIAGQLPKQFLPLDGKPILLHTIDRFQKHPSIHHIIIVTNGEFLQNTEDILDRQRNTAGTAYNKVMRVLTGGKTRQDSSRIGVMAADPEIYGNILIHDAARPFISKKIIDDILEKLETYSAVNLAIPSADTILEIDENNLIKQVPDRKYLRRVQTPQAFQARVIREAHQSALQKGFSGATDDCSLVLNMNPVPIYVVEGSPSNIKITYPIDLHLAEKILDTFR